MIKMKITMTFTIDRPLTQTELEGAGHAFTAPVCYLSAIGANPVVTSPVKVLSVVF